MRISYYIRKDVVDMYIVRGYYIIYRREVLNCSF